MHKDKSDSCLQVSDDTSFYLLCDEGILYSESRQEIISLNNPATYIWCCLEEALPLSQVIQQFSEAYQIPLTDASAHVKDMLQAWQGLGYLRGQPIPATSALDLTTALGRLLSSPGLRLRFSDSPTALAEEMGIRDDELEYFLAISPRALEAQAAMLRTQRESLETESGFAGDSNLVSVFHHYESLLKLAIMARLDEDEPTSRKVYRLLTTNFCLRYASSAQAEWVHPIISHLEIEPDDPVDIQLDILEAEGKQIVFEDAIPVTQLRTLEQLAPYIQARLKEAAIRRHSFFVEIHAGVLFDGDRCLLLPGQMGSGKTTLAAALMHGTWDLFSDDVALLGEGRLHVQPFPLSLIIKPGTEEVLSNRYPHIHDLKEHLRGDARKVRYLTPLPFRHVQASTDGYPVGWMIFPKFTPGAKTRLTELSKAQTLQRLVSDFVVLPSGLDRENVRVMVEWLRRIPCYELNYSSIEEAVRLAMQECS